MNLTLKSWKRPDQIACVHVLLQAGALAGLQRPACMEADLPFVAAQTQCPQKKRGRKPKTDQPAKTDQPVHAKGEGEELPEVHWRGSLAYTMAQRGFPLRPSAASLGFSTKGLSDEQVVEQQKPEEVVRKKVPGRKRKARVEENAEGDEGHGSSSGVHGLAGSSHEEMVFEAVPKVKKPRRGKSRKSLPAVEPEVKAKGKRVRSRGSSVVEPKVTPLIGNEGEVKAKGKRVRSPGLVAAEESQVTPLPKKVRSRGSMPTVEPEVMPKGKKARKVRSRGSPPAEEPNGAARKGRGKRSKPAEAALEEPVKPPQQTVRSSAVAHGDKKERSAEVKARLSRKSCAYKKARSEALAAGKTWEEAVVEAKAATRRTCI